MMNHKRIHPVSSFLVLLVVLVLGAGGAMAPVQAAPAPPGPDLAPQATTLHWTALLPSTQYKTSSTTSRYTISFSSHDRYRYRPAAAGGRVWNANTYCGNHHFGHFHLLEDRLYPEPRLYRGRIPGLYRYAAIYSLATRRVGQPER